MSSEVDDPVRKSITVTQDHDRELEKLVATGLADSYSGAIRWCIRVALDKAHKGDPRLFELNNDGVVILTGDMASFVKQVAERLAIPAEALLARMVEDTLKTYIEQADALDASREAKRRLIHDHMKPKEKKK